jgi:hypothetical protein
MCSCCTSEAYMYLLGVVVSRWCSCTSYCRCSQTSKGCTSKG